MFESTQACTILSIFSNLVPPFTTHSILQSYYPILCLYYPILCSYYPTLSQYWWISISLVWAGPPWIFAAASFAPESPHRSCHTSRWEGVPHSSDHASSCVAEVDCLQAKMNARLKKYVVVVSSHIVNSNFVDFHFVNFSLCQHSSTAAYLSIMHLPSCLKWHDTWK